MTRVELSMQVRDMTIAVRIANRLKLPDAIIAASALLYDAVLLSNEHGFEKVADLKRQSLKLKTSEN